MSQPLTFPCPFCGRRMGVGMELSGKHVRCPHCKQIVLAPTAAAVPPPAFAPAPAPDSGPVFNTAPRESAESILSDPEESEDEVFSSSKNGTRMRIPDLPEPGNPWGINDPVTRIDNREAAPAPPPPAADANPFAFPPPPPPVQPPPPPVPVPRAEVKSNNETTAEYTNPFATFEEPATPLPPPPPPPVPRAVAPKPAPPPPTGPTNPWSGLDDMVSNATVAAPAVVPVPTPVFQPPPPPVELPAPEPPSPRARPQPAPARGVSKGVFWAVAGYAIVATVLAVYGLFIKSGDKLDPGHPLSTIPDNFGEFPASKRKEVGKLSVPLDGPLPAEQKVALGKKIEIGQLEIEPLRVASRPLTIIGHLADGKFDQSLPKTAPALVLTLKVTNTSGDLPVYPLDPAFNRKEVSGVPTPGTGLVVGGKTFWGGPIEWPFSPRLKRMFDDSQADDTRPLKPKESREYVVLGAADGRAREALKGHDGTATWRVQVRRGLLPFRGKDIPVTAIVGVEFTRTDVRGL